MSSSEQAAWVQAIGSILAIFIAIAAPMIGDAIKGRRERQKQVVRARSIAIMVYPDLKALSLSMDRFMEQTAPGDLELTVNIDPLDGAYEEVIPKILAAAPLFDEMGALTKSMQNLAFELISIQQWHDMVGAISASASPGFYINNIGDIRIKVESARRQTNRILKDIAAERT